MAPALSLPSERNSQYDPSAESWPIKRPGASAAQRAPIQGRVSETAPLSDGSSKALIYKPGSKGSFVLTGGVEENVPRTPDDVAKYLRRMKVIINQYDRVATSTLMGASGANTDPASMSAAREQTLQFISQIRSTIPPADLKEAHGRLASTMADVSSLLDGSSSGLVGMGKGLALVSEVHNTMDGYHDGVRRCISSYGLPANLDPFSDEDAGQKARFAGQVEQYKAERTDQLQRPAASSGPDLGSLFGGGQSSGGMGDLGQLMKLMPGLLGGGNNGNDSGTGSLFGGESGN